MSPFRIVMLYVAAGALWILFSDRLLAEYVSSPELLTQFQSYKGWLYVCTTGVLLYLLVKRYDIEQKLDRERLVESKEYNRMLFNNSPAGLALCRMDGTMVDVNPAFAAIVGRSVEETLTLTCWDITPQNYAVQEEAQMKSLEETGRYGPYEKEYMHKDGHLVPVRLQGLLIEKDGEQFIWSSAEDISERKKAEAALQAHVRRNEQILHTMLDGFILADTEGKLLDVNLSYCAMVGYSREELLQMNIRDLEVQIPQEEIDRRIRHMVGQGFDRFETRHRCKDGSTIDLNVSIVIMQTETIPFVAAFVQDITERKRTGKELKKHREQLEEMVADRTHELERSRTALQYLLEDVNEAKKELEIANERLKELDHLKSMFIASMSHELRTPLNSIIGFTGIILQGMTGEINEEQRDQLQRVSKAGKHLLALITDVIDIAKIESGKIEPYPQEFELSEMISEACDSIKIQIQDKGLELKKNLPEGPILMKTDRKRLLQCLLNLLSNAVKFTEKGTVKIAASYKLQAASKDEKTGISDWQLETGSLKLNTDFVEISVADTGIGIKAVEMPLLFNSFVRLESHLRTTTPGTGLGLYLTKKLATEVLKGDVFAESTEGKGSRFTLRIPVRI